MTSNSKYSGNYTPTRRRKSTITIPERAYPHVKLIYAEMRRQNKTLDDVAEGSGLTRVCLKAWRTKNYPSLTGAEAALGFLGFEFVPIPTARALPPEIVEALKPIAARLNLALPAAVRLVAEVAYRDHHLKSIQPWLETRGSEVSASQSERRPDLTRAIGATRAS